MAEHFPFRPEKAVLLNSKSLSTRKNIFWVFFENLVVDTKVWFLNKTE